MSSDAEPATVATRGKWSSSAKEVLIDAADRRSADRRPEFDTGFVPALVAGHDPKWRPPPVTRVLECEPRVKWSPTTIVLGQRYETSEFCDSRPGRTIVVKVVDYDSSRGRWECVVVSSGPTKWSRGDRVYRLARHLTPKKPKGTP